MDSDLEEAYGFSAYAGMNRPFVVDGVERGNHWLEGDPDGERRYVCEWEVAGILPDLDVMPRFSLGVGRRSEGTRLPRARTGESTVDLRLAIETRAKDLARELLANGPARAALLGSGATLRVRLAGRGGSRASFERDVGSDVLSRGFEDGGGQAMELRLSGGLGSVEHVASRTAQRTAAGIADARSLVRQLDSLVRSTAWSEAAAYEVGAIDEAGLSRLIDAVLTASSWLSGHAARVGDGVEARLTLAIGQHELKGALTVRAVAEGQVSARLEVELPDAAGDALTLVPERGLGMWLRSFREHEIGDAALDDALLVEGDALRLPEVRAARGALGELLLAEPHIVLEEGRLQVELAHAPFDEALPNVLTAALETWDLISRQRLGLS